MACQIFDDEKAGRKPTKTTKFMKFNHLFRCYIPNIAFKQLLRIMKLITVIMVTFIVQIHASTFAQYVTLKENNRNLRSIFKRD